MKNIFKKNQVIITALAIMIAVAGYLNYSGMKFGEDTGKKETKTTSGKASGKELSDISDEDLYAEAKTGDIASNDVDLTSQSSDDSEESGKEETAQTSTPGEAVLASSQIVSQAKLNREQVRAKNKETYMEIINNEKLTDAQKQEAVNNMISMTDMAEKEAAAESLLAAKGFTEAVVSVTGENADVVVNLADVSDAKRAQIEDIVKRKTGISAENIVITPIAATE